MAFPSFTKTYHTAFYDALSPTRPEVSTAGKVVLITGGGSGMGPRVAAAYARSGTTSMTLLGRTESSLLATKSSLEAAYPGLKVLTCTADIADPIAVEAAFVATKAAFGPISILVQNAGYLPDSSPLATTDLPDFMKGFQVNVLGNLILAQVFLRYMSADSPTIVHTTTAAVHLPPLPGYFSAYGASKLAAVKMLENFAVENQSVRVMMVHPGIIETGMALKFKKAGLDMPTDDGMFFSFFSSSLSSSPLPPFPFSSHIPAPH